MVLKFYKPIVKCVDTHVCEHTHTHSHASVLSDCNENYLQREPASAYGRSGTTSNTVSYSNF